MWPESITLPDPELIIVLPGVPKTEQLRCLRVDKAESTAFSPPFNF